MRFASPFLVAAPGRAPARPGRGLRAGHGPSAPHPGLRDGARGAGGCAGWADWGVFRKRSRGGDFGGLYFSFLRRVDTGSGACGVGSGDPSEVRLERNGSCQDTGDPEVKKPNETRAGLGGEDATGHQSSFRGSKHVDESATLGLLWPESCWVRLCLAHQDAQLGNGSHLL